METSTGMWVTIVIVVAILGVVVGYLVGARQQTAVTPVEDFSTFDESAFTDDAAMFDETGTLDETTTFDDTFATEQPTSGATQAPTATSTAAPRGTPATAE